MTRRALSLLLAALLFVGPSAPAWAQVNVPSETIIVEATVLATAVHVATVAAGAHATIDGVDLSPYLGAKLTLRDSSGWTAVGYIMRAGTGEALTELLADTGFDDAGSWVAGAGFVVNGAGSSAAVATTSTTEVRQTLGSQQGKLLLTTIICSAITGGTYQTLLSSTLLGGSYNDTGTKVAYKTAT
ncbi:MAG: hypothetical protein ABIJ75_03660, partial [Actinomycetota bacterium]